MLWFALSGMETMLFLALGSWLAVLPGRALGVVRNGAWAVDHHPPGRIILVAVIGDLIPGATGGFERVCWSP
jgi:hypothetical protein